MTKEKEQERKKERKKERRHLAAYKHYSASLKFIAVSYNSTLECGKHLSLQPTSLKKERTNIAESWLSSYPAGLLCFILV